MATETTASRCRCQSSAAAADRLRARDENCQHAHRHPRLHPARRTAHHARLRAAGAARQQGPRIHRQIARALGWPRQGHRPRPLHRRCAVARHALRQLRERHSAARKGSLHRHFRCRELSRREGRARDRERAWAMPCCAIRRWNVSKYPIVRYAGQPIAAVAATSPQAAEEAAAKVKVQVRSPALRRGSGQGSRSQCAAGFPRPGRSSRNRGRRRKRRRYSPNRQCPRAFGTQTRRRRAGIQRRRRGRG